MGYHFYPIDITGHLILFPFFRAFMGKRISPFFLLRFGRRAAFFVQKCLFYFKKIMLYAAVRWVKGAQFWSHLSM